MANADGLDRMKALLEALGNPEKDLNVIHVAGTNGKGSTCVMIASVLVEAGCSVGLYTSPHLETECERIQIWKGEERCFIEQKELDSLRGRINNTFASIDSTEANGGLAQGGGLGKLTVFETYTAAAYLYYAEKRPDYVILECGMGGRLDSTNTIESPLVSVITQISLDHTDELGSTIEEVAYNKAGIIKRGRPVVSQSEDERVKTVIRSVADEMGSRFIDASEEGKAAASYPLAMRGEYQKKNAATAVCAVKAAGIEASEDAVRRGLEKATLPGRFEILGEDPFFIVDGAHNPGAMSALADEFKSYAKENEIKQTVFIFGCMQDKDSHRMAEILTHRLSDCSFLTVSIEYGRAESAEKLKDLITAAGCKCRACASTEEALSVAMDSGADCILTAGSIYLAGDLRSLYKKGSNAVESD